MTKRKRKSAKQQVSNLLRIGYLSPSAAAQAAGESRVISGPGIDAGAGTLPGAFVAAARLGKHPAATASAAANRRRPCSSNTGASASNRSRIADTSITRIGYSIASLVGIPPRSKNHHPPIHLFADGS